MSLNSNDQRHSRDLHLQVSGPFSVQRQQRMVVNVLFMTWLKATAARPCSGLDPLLSGRRSTVVRRATANTGRGKWGCQEEPEEPASDQCSFVSCPSHTAGRLDTRIASCLNLVWPLQSSGSDNIEIAMPVRGKSNLAICCVCHTQRSILPLAVS